MFYLVHVAVNLQGRGSRRALLAAAGIDAALGFRVGTGADHQLLLGGADVGDFALPRDALRSRGSNYGVNKRLAAIVHGIVHGSDPFFTPPGVEEEGEEQEEEEQDGDKHSRRGWTRRFRSASFDRILCLLCLRTHPGCGCCSPEKNRALFLLMPMLFCVVIFVAWGIIIWTIGRTDTIHEGVGGVQLALHMCVYVVGALGQVASAVTVVRASHDSTLHRHYFLPATRLPAEAQKRSDTTLCRWWAGLSLAACVVAALLFSVFFNDPAKGQAELMAMFIFSVLIVLSVHPQIVLQGLLDARITDLTENMVCFSVLAQQTFQREVSDVSKFHELLETARKMVGMVQAFSWDWQRAILGALASPLAVTLVFAFQIASVVGVLVSAGIGATTDYWMGLLIFLVAGVIMNVACFLSTMYKLSRVAAAGFKLKKLVDYCVKRDHLKDEETARVIGEIRHLLHTRAVVKVMGGAITPGFVLNILKSLAKVLSLAIGLLVTAGSASSAAAKTGNATAMATRL